MINIVVELERVLLVEEISWRRKSRLYGLKRVINILNSFIYWLILISVAMALRYFIRIMV